MTTTNDASNALQDERDRRAIRDLIENWAVWRDAGDWNRFRTVWHDDGRMNATWKQGTADEFIADCRGRLGLLIIGLMCIPPEHEEPALHFALLREIGRRHPQVKFFDAAWHLAPEQPAKACYPMSARALLAG